MEGGLHTGPGLEKLVPGGHTVLAGSDCAVQGNIGTDVVTEGDHEPEPLEKPDVVTRGDRESGPLQKALQEPPARMACEELGLSWGLVAESLTTRS